MQRKPSYPVTNCSIKMPDCPPNMDITASEDDNEQQQRRQQLINFGHSQWGFNNWSWSVTKQELDFVDFANGKYCAGVVAFVSITLKTLDIHRENIGYATSNANTKGLAIYKSRKCAVTNALRETLLSFGGNVATELLELIEVARNDVTVVNAPVTSLPDPAHQVENNQNIINRLPEPKTSPVAMLPRKDEPRNLAGPPVARAHPMPASLPVRPPGPPGPPAVAAVAGAPLTAGRLAVPPGGAGAGAAVAGPAALRPNSNEVPKTGLEGMSEEEARAERKRRQRLAQEEFKQRQLLKNNGLDDQHEISKGCSSFDRLLMDIPTQDIVIEQTGPMADSGKRKSPTPDNTRAKRRSSFVNKLDIVTTD